MLMQSIFAGPIACARRLAARAGLSRFRRDQDGATAVEFALVATPFFALLFAIIETALVFFAGQALDTSVQSAARLIRTGQAQADSMSASAFKTAICDGAGVLIDCTKLKVDVQNPGTFAEIDSKVPRDPETNELDVTENYPTTHGGDIVVVRAYYAWPVIVSRLFGSSLGGEPDGSHLLVATAAFRNEPFSW